MRFDLSSYLMLIFEYPPVSRCDTDLLLKALRASELRHIAHVGRAHDAFVIRRHVCEELVQGNILWV